MMNENLRKNTSTRIHANVFYTYFHTRNDTGAVFYVGKGKGRRAHEAVNRNIYWKNIVAKSNHAVHIARSELSEAEAFEHEVFLIECFKGLGTPLANLTNGGEGTSGFLHSSNTKGKISNSLLGHEVSSATRANLSLKLTGRKLSDETKFKIKQSGLGRKWTDDSRAKFSASTKGVLRAHLTPEVMAKIQSAAADAVRGKQKAKIECPHCNKIGGDAPMKRWHFDNCRSKTPKDIDEPRKPDRNRTNPYAA